MNFRVFGLYVRIHDLGLDAKVRLFEFLSSILENKDFFESSFH